MRIMHLVNSLDNGGVTSVALDLAHEQQKQGHDVLVLQLRRGPWTGRASTAGLSMSTGISTLTRLLRTARPDIMHCHQRRCGTISVALGQRKRTVEHVHNRLVGQQLFSYRGATVVAVSTQVAAHLEENYPFLRDKVSTIPNAAAVPSDPNDRRSPPLRDIIAVGRLHEEKDSGYFLTVLASLRDEMPSVRALWVGDGPERQEFLARRSALGLTNAVEWIPELRREDVLVEMARSRTVMITSQREGWPMVAIEAFAVGTPVVSTAVGDLSDYITANRAGAVMPRGNPAAAAATLRTSLSYEPETHRHVRHLFSRDFNAAAAVRSWEKLYEHLV